MASLSISRWRDIIDDNGESAVTGAGAVRDVATLGAENATSIGDIGALASLAQAALCSFLSRNSKVYCEKRIGCKRRSYCLLEAAKQESRQYFGGWRADV